MADGHVAGGSGGRAAWADALQFMPAGSKWQLFIPSELAYGERGAGSRSDIGPNATLIFEVELLSVQEAAGARTSAAIAANEPED